MNPIGGGPLDKGETASQGVGNEIHVDYAGRRETAKGERGEQQQKGPFPKQELQSIRQGTIAGRCG